MAEHMTKGDTNWQKLYYNKIRDNNILRTNDIEGAAPKRNIYDKTSLREDYFSRHSGVTQSLNGAQFRQNAQKPQINPLTHNIFHGDQSNQGTLGGASQSYEPQSRYDLQQTRMRNPIYSDYAYSNSPTYPAARRGVGIGGQDSLDMFKNEYDTGKSYTNQIQQQNSYGQGGQYGQQQQQQPQHAAGKSYRSPIHGSPEYYNIQAQRHASNYGQPQQSDSPLLYGQQPQRQASNYGQPQQALYDSPSYGQQPGSYGQPQKQPSNYGQGQYDSPLYGQQTQQASYPGGSYDLPQKQANNYGQPQQSDSPVYPNQQGQTYQGSYGQPQQQNQRLDTEVANNAGNFYGVDETPQRYDEPQDNYNVGGQQYNTNTNDNSDFKPKSDDLYGNDTPAPETGDYNKNYDNFYRGYTPTNNSRKTPQVFKNVINPKNPNSPFVKKEIYAFDLIKGGPALKYQAAPDKVANKNTDPTTRTIKENWALNVNAGKFFDG